MAAEALIPEVSSAGRAPQPPHKPRKGDELEFVIERFDERGAALGRAGEWHVRTERAIPGERVQVGVLRRRRNQVDARVLERLAPSPDAVEARCLHFGSCGGCSFQNLSYAAQLAGLGRLVEDALRAHGLAGIAPVEPVIGAVERWRYRNRMEFTFGSRRWIDPAEPVNAVADFALGMHAKDLHSKVVDVRACQIQAEACDAILASVRELAREQQLAPWDLRTHTGLLRYAVLRRAHATGEILLNLVTSADALDVIEPYAAAIVARHPELTTLVQNVNSRPASTAQGEYERVLHGPGVIVERVLGITFQISANSFFQTNTAQAERLFELVREEARLTQSEIVHDLYCGTGSIALVLAHAARAVYGCELAPSAVADARRNAEANAITNVHFAEGDVLCAFESDWPRPDVIVADPPRAGLHPKVLPRLIELAPQRIVYVSCNPGSAARDCAALTASAYRLTRVRPIDLFPHTPHVESVFTLERVS